MIEVIGALFRWLQLASNMILIGGCVFLAIAVRANTALDAPWLARLERALPWLSIALLLGLLGLLATTTAQATGMAENAWRPGAWLELLQKTRIGLIWKGRAALALLVFGVALYIRFSPRARWQYVLCATTAALTLAAGSLASHSAAEELSVTSVLPYALHIILASVWFGGLPAFLTVMFATTGKQSPEEVVGSHPDPEAFLCNSAARDGRYRCHRHHRCGSHGGHELRLIGRDELRLVAQYKACVARADSHDRRVRAPHLACHHSARTRMWLRPEDEDFESGSPSNSCSHRRWYWWRQCWRTPCRQSMTSLRTGPIHSGSPSTPPGAS